MVSFIEKQFPVSKISKESYKERKAGAGQTLTGLGKWWGRKPLALVRAAVIGSIMPASNNPKLDMEIFLKIMSMDEKGLLLRLEKPFSVQELYNICEKNKKLRPYINEWFDLSGNKVKINNDIDKKEVELKVFNTLGYDEKLAKCMRPEQLKKIDIQTWNEINNHLGTSAKSLKELIEQLSIRTYGRNVLIGDCFCGGGSIPFEAARIGCETYASDLNPIASVLTYAALNILSGGSKDIERIKKFQNDVFDEVRKEIDLMGIETNSEGKRSHFYIYCVEATCPECGCVVPLSSNWVISKHKKVVASLKYNGNRNNFDINIIQNASKEDFTQATEQVTVKKNSLFCLHCGKSTPIQVLRKDRKNENNETVYGLRRWEKNEFIPRLTDVFRERLYCVKYFKKFDNRTWEETIKRPAAATDASFGEVEYRTPNEEDIKKEEYINNIVNINLNSWMEDGIIPSSEIEIGYNTEQVIRERGWQYWHQLFNPRQLLTNSLFIKKTIELAKNKDELIIGLLGANKIIDRNSKLCIWHVMDKQEKGENTFYNQALNTLYNYTTRSLSTLFPTWYLNLNSTEFNSKSFTAVMDAREVKENCDIWITDPPYADAINYHELSELFLSWNKKLLKVSFPEWYVDSKRILAVKGDEHFSHNMIEIYTNLAKHTTDNGLQIVMFTHSDASVWAQLAIIMWKAGLKVTAAWNIATETDSGGLKEGNYVKGTVLLVLRKQIGNNTAYLDEINGDIKAEVKAQIESMQSLENKEEPNFSDPDYVLAAYAASLKVLTSYKKIGGIDLDYELNLAINNPANSEVVKIIENAKKRAFDCIIPADFESHLWRDLSPAERFYIKGLEAEKHNNYQISTYQEYARGFSIGTYSQLMANEKANTARLKTAFEFAMKTISDNPDFEKSVLRIVLAAIYISIKEDGVPEKGLYYIKSNVVDYWSSRDMIKQLLRFLKDTKDIDNMPHWLESADMAEHLFILVDNDHI